jgi:small subunit ribosomal protein S15
MSLTSVQREEIINQYKRSDNDTGSSEVQVSMMTARIKYLTEHFKVERLSFTSRLTKTG